MKKMSKLLAMLLAVAMICGMLAVSASATDVTLPREETLYFGGQQWGAVNSWNPVGTNQNNSMAIAGNAGGYRTTMFETLFMFDFLSGEKKGLLADSYEWNEDLTAMTVTLKDAAHWSDGTPVTAADVVATWDVGVLTNNGTGAGFKAYIEKIEATGDKTLVITAKLTEDGKPVNPLKVEDFICGTPIAQAAWIATLCERNDNDPTKILNDAGEDVVWSGPYTKYYTDDQKVVMIRDDNYWGQDESMWGKLPVPKYLAHNLYADNAATELAFKAGEIDVDQQFLGNIQNLWLEEDLPISTFYEEAPYGV